MSMEQFKALLENSTGLTDDFKKSAEPIFQEAVEAVVAERLDEECKKAVEKALKEKEECDCKAKEDEKKAFEEEKCKAVEEKAKEIKESFLVQMEESANKIASLEESIEALDSEYTSELESVMEQVDALAEEKSAELAEQMVSRIDSYMNYVVEQFVKENKEALVAKKQHEVSESFLNDLGALFEQHNIEKPEGFTKVQEELEATKAELVRINKDLSEQLLVRQSLEEQIADHARKDAIRSIAEQKSLSVSEREKLEHFMEDFHGELDAFVEKATNLAESFEPETPADTKQIVTQSAVIEEHKEESKPMTEAAMLANRMRRFYQ